jgi:thiamine-monophosphate kinase
MPPPDEFHWIDRLKRLTRDDPRALGLLDDAAVIPSRRGFDLVVSTDAMIEGVHFLKDERPEVVARRLLRTSLSDLAAKAARPFAYLLTTAWPAERPMAWRERFIDGLAADGDEFGVALLGGDTVATTGPLAVSATVLGWSPAGGAILRSNGQPDDELIVCGVIGDGWLGLKAARGEIPDPGGRLASQYRLPRPLLGLRDALTAHAHAAADVSDGLLADAGHIAGASRLGLRLELEALPLSLGGAAWLERQADERAARLQLAAGGDDYAIVCAVAPGEAAQFIAEATAIGAPAARMGVFTAEPGLDLRLRGAPVRTPAMLGWRH